MNVMLFVVRFNENHSKRYTDCLSVWIREVLSFSLQQLLRIGGKIMSLWTSFCQFNASYVRIKETLPCLLGTKSRSSFLETQPQYSGLSTTHVERDKCFLILYDTKECMVCVINRFIFWHARKFVTVSHPEREIFVQF